MKVGKKSGARPASPAPDQESDRQAIEWMIGHVEQRQKLRRDLLRQANVASPNLAIRALLRIFVSTDGPNEEAHEAELLGLKRRLFVLDHPELPHGWGDDGEIVLEDWCEVQFRLERT
jgi:hypothetical protein